MKKLTFSLLLLFLFFQVSAQQFTYQPIKSSGELPYFLFSSSTEKYQASIQQMEKNEEGLTEKQQEKFYLENHFRIDALLESGKVVFNDPIGKYINEVADVILKEKTGLREELSFYLVKSPFPNAFTTSEGIIFVNVGLLSRLETEAQLAFVLCHEIAHYQAKHIIKGYARSVSLETGKGGKSTLSDIKKLILKNNYSQENERLADSIGFELFCGTAYSTETLPSVFEILKAAHQPYLFPESPFLPLKNPYWNPNYTPSPEEESLKDSMDNTALLAELETENEENEEDVGEPIFSTHPSPTQRKELLIQQLIQASHSGDQLFIVSRDKFRLYHQQAAYELCRMFLLDAAYFDALYQAIGLLENSPDDPYLNQVVMKALYGIGKYRNESQSIPAFIDYDGQPFHLKHFYGTFAKKKFGEKSYLFLAICYAKHHLDQFPGQQGTRKYLEDLMIDFLKIFPNFATQNDTADAHYRVFKPAIDRMYSDTLFQHVYDKAVKERKRIDNFHAYRVTPDGKKEIDKYERRVQRKGYHLGIDSVVLFSPFYYWIDARKDMHIDFLKTEKEQDRLPEFIDKSAKKLDLSVTLLDARTMNKQKSSHAFNDLVLSSEWYGDFLQHGDFRMIPSVYDEMLELSKKYGSPYFANMGTVSLRLHQKQQYNAMILGILIIPLPWTTYMSFKKASHNNAFFMVMNVEENHIIAYQSHEIRELIVGPMLEAYTYYYLWQIKADKK